MKVYPLIFDFQIYSSKDYPLLQKEFDDENLRFTFDVRGYEPGDINVNLMDRKLVLSVFNIFGVLEA